MSDDAKQSMTMNINLSADEQAKVEAIDGLVFDVALNEQGINARLLWDAVGDAAGRTIRLLAIGQTQPLLTIPEGEFANLSESDVVDRLRRRPR